MRLNAHKQQKNWQSITTWFAVFVAKSDFGSTILVVNPGREAVFLSAAESRCRVDSPPTSET